MSDEFFREADLLIYDQPGRHGYLRHVVNTNTYEGVVIAVVDPASGISHRRFVDDTTWETPFSHEVAYRLAEDALRRYLDRLEMTLWQAKLYGTTRIKLVGGPAAGDTYSVPVNPEGIPPQVWRVPLPSRPAVVGLDLMASEPWTTTWRDATYECEPLPDEDGVWLYRATGH